MPKVSIILPTYNRAEYLRKAIDSIIFQKFIDFEIIIVDNNSTDGTSKIVAEFTSDKRVKYYRNNKNIGVTNNHNLALSKASGEYVAFFSDDDIMLTDSLSKRVEVLEKNRDVVMVHTSLDVINEHGKVVQKGHWAAEMHSTLNLLSGVQEKEIVQSTLLNNWNYISMPSAMVRNSVIQDNNLMFNPSLRFLIDWDLWVSLAEFGSFYYLDEELLLYRRHSSNETSAISSEIATCEILLMKLGFYNRYRADQLSSLDMNDFIEKVGLQVISQYGPQRKKRHFLKRFF